MAPNRINDLEGKARDWQWNQWVAEPGIEGVRWCGDTGRLWWQWYSVAGGDYGGSGWCSAAW